jgi:hypothetical protein
VISWFKYVRFAEAEDYLRLGWAPTAALGGTGHGEWSVLMAWLCDCRPAYPSHS